MGRRKGQINNVIGPVIRERGEWNWRQFFIQWYHVSGSWLMSVKLVSLRMTLIRSKESACRIRSNCTYGHGQTWINLNTSHKIILVSPKLLQFQEYQALRLIWHRCHCYYYTIWPRSRDAHWKINLFLALSCILFSGHISGSQTFSSMPVSEAEKSSRLALCSFHQPLTLIGE